MDFKIGKTISLYLTKSDKEKLVNHVKSVDKLLTAEYKYKGLSRRFEEILNNRFFTYTEYLELFDLSIPEEKFHEHGAYLFLQIEREHGYWDGDERVRGRRDFTNLYTPDEKGYANLLLANKGKTFFRIVRANVPYGSLKEHAHIVGKTRSGKSEFLRLLFYSLQDWSQKKRNLSLVLIDPQGDLAKKIKSSHLNIDSERLVYIAPNLKKGYVPVINPLQLENNSELLLEKTTEFLVEAFDEMLNDQTLSDQMRTVLTPCIYTLLKRGDSSLEELQKFMLNDPELIELGKKSSIKPHRDFFKTKFLQYKNGKEIDTFTRSKTAVYSRIQNLLNSPKFYHMTMGQSTVNLSKAFNSGKVVIFDLSGLGGITKDAYGRFVIAKIKAIAENREIIPEKFRKPTFVFIDECQYFITTSIERTLSEMGKYGLHLILAHQYIRQLGNMAEAVLSNTDLKVVFNNHESTLQKFSSYMGMKVSDMRQGWKKYECYIKTGERRTVKVKPSSKLIKKKKYTLPRKVERIVNNEMIKHYYKKITNDTIVSKPTIDKENLSLNKPLYELYLGK